MAKDKLSCSQAVAKVLAEAEQPLTADEVSERVLALPNHHIGGKTPKATIGAELYVGAKKGRYVKLARSQRHKRVRFKASTQAPTSAAAA